MPSTTALVLCWYGRERGLYEALATAEASLLGLVAAVTLPVVYARAAGSGLGLPGSPLLAVASYVSAAGLLSVLTGLGPVPSACFSAMGVASVARFAATMRLGIAGHDPPGGARPQPWWVVLGLRTAVPIFSVTLVNTIRALAGPERAGLFLTFPGMTLAVLVTTHLESGPGHASRMARALPAGNLGMVAFLTTFRFGCPVLGLAGGTLLGFVAALSVLVAIEMASQYPVALRASLRRSMTIPTASWQAFSWTGATRARLDRLGEEPGAHPWCVRSARSPRRTRFAPLVEALAG